MVAVAIGLPAVLLAVRLRHARTEDLEPGLLRRLPYPAQAATSGSSPRSRRGEPARDVRALLAHLSDSHRTIERAFWIGLATVALLALVPRRRISLAFNSLVALGSLFLVVQLMQIERGPEDAVAIDLPVEGVWFVASGGRSPLVNGHYALRSQRYALDLFQVVDGKTHHGGADLLDNYYAYKKRLLAPGGYGTVTEVIDTRPDAPVGDSDLEHPEGNIVVISSASRRRCPRRRMTGRRACAQATTSFPDRTSASSATRETRTSRTCTSRWSGRDASRRRGDPHRRIVVAFGKVASGLFGQPESWVETVRRASARAGDRLWPLPLYEKSSEQLRSEIADLVNTGGRPAGACTAAIFLKEFAGGLPWAHLDIAGTAWADEAKPWQPKGPTGVAVRTLAELAFMSGEWK